MKFSNVKLFFLGALLAASLPALSVPLDLSSPPEVLTEVSKATFRVEDDENVYGSGLVVQGDILVTHLHTLNTIIRPLLNPNNAGNEVEELPNGLLTTYITNGDKPEQYIDSQTAEQKFFIQGILGADAVSNLAFLKLADYTGPSVTLNSDQVPMPAGQNYYLMGFLNENFNVFPLARPEVDETQQVGISPGELEFRRRNYGPDHYNVDGMFMVNGEGILLAAARASISIAHYGTSVERIQTLITENDPTQMIASTESDRMFDWYWEDIMGSVAEVADKGDVLVQYELGRLFQEGKLVPPNFREAFYWYSEAADQDHPRAQFMLALAYGRGIVPAPPQQQMQLAAQWLSKSSELGFHEAKFMLGVLRYESANGPFAHEQMAMAMPLFLDAAELGHPGAQLYLANIHLGGDLNTEQNYETAFEFALQAANQLFPDALELVAEMYYNGVGTVKDLQESARWLRIAMDQGSQSATMSLAFMYEHGEGVTQDSSIALAMLNELIEEGFLHAQYILAGAYLAGGSLGLEQDVERGVELLIDAAEKGDPNSQYTLSVLYYNGELVEENLEEAYKWLVAAAQNGHPTAQQLLSNLASMAAAPTTTAPQEAAPATAAAPQDGQ